MNDIIALLQSPYASIIPILLVAYIIKQFSLSELTQWFLKRKQERLALLNEQLKEGNSLSQEMQTHLSNYRERLLLQITEGISANVHLAKAIMCVSEDQVGGITWSELRAARPHLELDNEGKLHVNVSKISWVFGILIGFVAVMCLVLFILYVLLVLGTLYTNDYISAWRNVLLAGTYVIAGRLFFVPRDSIIVAYRIKRRLQKT